MGSGGLSSHPSSEQRRFQLAHGGWEWRGRPRALPRCAGASTDLSRCARATPSLCRCNVSRADGGSTMARGLKPTPLNSTTERSQHHEIDRELSSPQHAARRRRGLRRGRHRPRRLLRHGRRPYRPEERGTLPIVGIGLVAYAAYLVVASRREPLSLYEAWAFATADLLWVAGSAALITSVRSARTATGSWARSPWSRSRSLSSRCSASAGSGRPSPGLALRHEAA